MAKQLSYGELKRISDVVNCPVDVVALLIAHGSLYDVLENRRVNVTRRRDGCDRQLATIERIKQEMKA